MRKLILTIAIIITPCFSYALGEFDTLRCNNGIVSKGDTKYEVLQKCGKPARDESVYRKYSYSGRYINKVLNQWTYDFGPQEFIYLVNFDGSGIVYNVYNTGSYGIKRPLPQTSNQ
jgi:hypothetical protein